MFKYICLLVCLSYSCSARSLSNDSPKLLANENSLDAYGYISAVLQRSQRELENIRNLTHMDFYTLFPVHIKVDDAPYYLNATLHFVGFSGETEIIDNTTSFSIDSASINISTVILLPHLLYDIVFELDGNDTIFIGSGVGENMNINMTASWNFTANDLGVYEIQVKGTSGSGLGGDSIVAINAGNLSADLQSQIVKELRSLVRVPANSIFSPFSDIVFDATDAVNVNKFLLQDKNL